MIIGVDVDDVLADLVPEWLERYNNKYNDTLSISEITYWAAMLRHAFKWWAGEEYDEEMGIHHLIAVAWGAINLRYYTQHESYKKYDDRVNNNLNFISKLYGEKNDK